MAPLSLLQFGQEDAPGCHIAWEAYQQRDNADGRVTYGDAEHSGDWQHRLQEEKRINLYVMGGTTEGGVV